MAVFICLQRTITDADESNFPLHAGEVQSKQAGPLTWSKTGGMHNYNLIVRENAFVQIWFNSGANNRDVHHALTVYVDMEGNVSNIVGPKKKEDVVCKQKGPGRPPLRRSTRVATKTAYENVSPTAQQIADFDQLLSANLGIQGKYTSKDMSIHTT